METCLNQRTPVERLNYLDAIVTSVFLLGDEYMNRKSDCHSWQTKKWCNRRFTLKIKVLIYQIALGTLLYGSEMLTTYSRYEKNDLIVSTFAVVQCNKNQVAKKVSNTEVV